MATRESTEASEVEAPATASAPVLQHRPQPQQERTAGRRQAELDAYTFGVCQYNGTQANVTVDVRDVDGQTRRFLVTLRGRKAASLMTISPVGAVGYLPESGWCNPVGTDPAAIGETTTGSFDESRRATKGDKKE